MESKHLALVILSLLTIKCTLTCIEYPQMSGRPPIPPPRISRNQSFERTVRMHGSSRLSGIETHSSEQNRLNQNSPKPFFGVMDIKQHCLEILANISKAINRPSILRLALKQRNESNDTKEIKIFTDRDFITISPGAYSFGTCSKSPRSPKDQVINSNCCGCLSGQTSEDQEKSVKSPQSISGSSPRRHTAVSSRPRRKTYTNSNSSSFRYFSRRRTRRRRRTVGSSAKDAVTSGPVGTGGSSFTPRAMYQNDQAPRVRPRCLTHYSSLDVQHR